MHIGYRTIDRQLEEIRGRLETRTIAHSLIVAIARGQLVLDIESESVSTPDPVELVAV